MENFATVEGDITAADTETVLNTLGSESTATDMLVPQGMKYVRHLFISAGMDEAAVDAGLLLVRAKGKGMKDQSNTFVGHGLGAGTVAQGTGFPSLPYKYENVWLAVTPGEKIAWKGESAGGDSGTVTVGVTAQFTDQAPPTGYGG